MATALHPKPEALLAEVDERLALVVPDPYCELDHDDAWQLLVVTILSAQARDAVINEIRPALFARWPTPADLAKAPQEEVEVVVKRSGYYRQKAKAIRECAKAIVERHEGEVPRTHEALVDLPGASHKTANLVLGIAFGVASGIVVDTHVARVSERLGLVAKAKPPKIEKRLCELAPRESWIAISHRLILHGRYLCTSKSPDCPACPLNNLCTSASASASADWRSLAVAERELIAAKGDRSKLSTPAAPAPAAPSAPDPASELYADAQEDEEDF